VVHHQIKLYILSYITNFLGLFGFSIEFNTATFFRMFEVDPKNNALSMDFPDI